MDAGPDPEVRCRLNPEDVKLCALLHRHHAASGVAVNWVQAVSRHDHRGSKAGGQRHTSVAILTYSTGAIAHTGHRKTAINMSQQSNDST